MECRVDACRQEAARRGVCYLHYDRGQRQGNAEVRAAMLEPWEMVRSPLTCQCAEPIPEAWDMCLRCLRVIADRVIARREQR